jgi:hypothetical protein
MGKAIIKHIDEASWILGKPRRDDGTLENASHFIGDMEKGPWIHVNSVEPNSAPSEPHSHNMDEVIYVVEGSITIGDRTYGPGTVIAIEKDTAYDFTSGPEGLRFLNIRPGRANLTMGGVTYDQYGKDGAKFTKS